eukprot:3486638-Amphidinium_carterae.2
MQQVYGACARVEEQHSTSRPLGGPAKTTEWNSGAKEALATPRPGNMLATMSMDTVDKYGRFLMKYEVDVILNTSVERNTDMKSCNSGSKVKGCLHRLASDMQTIQSMDHRISCSWPGRQRSPYTDSYQYQNKMQHHYGLK